MKRLSAIPLSLACLVALMTSGASADAPTVALVSAGSGSKQVLRYTPKVGDKRVMSMVMSMDTAMVVGGNPAPKQKMPGMVTTMTATVETVAASGDITYAFEYTSTGLEGDDGVNPQVVAAVKKALQGLVGLKGRAVVSSRGFNKQVDLAIPKGVDPMLKQTLETMKKSMKQMSAPLPAEAVGQGAKWTVTARITEGFVTMTQIAHTTLVKIDGRRIELGMRIEQKAPRQKIKHPQMPPSAKVELMSLVGSGTGTLGQSLDHVMPEKSGMNSSHVIVMQTQAEGMPTMRMKMTTKIGLKITSKPTR